jgi:hypothetical protein
MIGTAFGPGTSLSYPPQQLGPWAGTFSGSQGPGFNPFGSPTLAQTLTPAPFGSTAASPNPTQTLQQILQLLQVLPNQLQQLQHVQYVQHHILQQLLQVIPAQLSQLQQLIQFVPQQIQQIQQGAQFQQPFGQLQGSAGAGYGVATPWGIAPPAHGGQPTQVM